MANGLLLNDNWDNKDNIATVTKYEGIGFAERYKAGILSPSANIMPIKHCEIGKLLSYKQLLFSFDFIFGGA